MKRCLTFCCALFFSALCIQAQDSLRVTAIVDSTYLGKDIYDILPKTSKGDAASANVYQNPAIANELEQYIQTGQYDQINGYRIRIYFSNSQDAREASSATLNRFLSLFPSCSAYRTYANPNFKVTVGDFETRSEALRWLEPIRRDFPAAFIVKEKIFSR